jgi:hypothetical protein
VPGSRFPIVCTRLVDPNNVLSPDLVVVLLEEELLDSPRAPFVFFFAIFEAFFRNFFRMPGSGSAPVFPSRFFRSLVASIFNFAFLRRLLLLLFLALF